MKLLCKAFVAPTDDQERDGRPNAPELYEALDQVLSASFGDFMASWKWLPFLKNLGERN